MPGKKVKKAKKVQAAPEPIVKKGTAKAAAANAKAAAVAEKAKPKKKLVRKGFSTREVAEQLDTTPAKVRRILRSEGFFPDGDYTRYDLTKEDVKRIGEALKEGRTNVPTKGKAPKGKASKAKKAAPAAEEVSDDLDDLEDEDDEEEEIEEEDDEEEEDEDEDDDE